MQTPATAVDSDSTSQTESGKSVALGQPPFPLGGVRRKSGWGKRFKEREQGRLAIIFPRRKNGEETRGSDAVWLSVDVLNSLSDRSLASAAKILGISATALKKACRELGVERWPYHRNRKAGSVSAEEKSRANTVSPPSPAEPMDFMDLLHRNAVMVLEAAKKLDAQKLDFPDAPVV